jgi:hypothetical protein
VVIGVASKCQIACYGFAAMLFGDNMVDLEWN